MNSAERILVIFLSTFLAFALLLSIIALIKAIQVLNYLKQASKSAAAVAQNIEHAGAFFEKTAAPVALGKFIANITDNFKKRSKGKD